MPIDLNTQMVRVAGLMASPVENDLVILNLKTNNYVALDAIGRRIWELLAQPQQVAALCTQLSQEFDASPEQVASDVLPFLAELEQEGLVYIVGQQPG